MPKRGQVKWFNNRAGWGFIRVDGAPDIFVRHDRIQGDGYKVLQSGDMVEFDVRKGKRGPYAIKVVRVGKKAAASQERAS